MNLNLVLAQLLLSVMGTLGVAVSAPDLIPKHILQTVLALAVTFFVARIRPTWLLKVAPFAWGMTLFLLLLTLIIGVGGNDSAVRRWLDFGAIRFQPSEFAKLTLVLMLGNIVARKGIDTKLFGSSAIIGITSLLIVLEPDLGTTVLVFGSGIFMMYMAGVRISNITKLLTLVGLLTIPAAGIYLETHPYIKARYEAFIQGIFVQDSEAIKAHQSDEGYQIEMARRAMGRGGAWGLGIDEPLPSVPADHTDMIIASIGFSVGFIGFLTVVLGFWLVVHSSIVAVELLLRRAPLTPELHGACVVAAGAMFMIVAQALTNLLVAVGIVPVTGVPLPMVSYGGSSQLAVGIAFGLLHSALRLVWYDRPQNPALESLAVVEASP